MGPHSEYLLDTPVGRLLVREPGPPRHGRGDEVGWLLRESWPVEVGPAGQSSSSAAGPE